MKFCCNSCSNLIAHSCAYHEIFHAILFNTGMCEGVWWKYIHLQSCSMTLMSIMLHYIVFDVRNSGKFGKYLEFCKVRVHF